MRITALDLVSLNIVKAEWLKQLGGDDPALTIQFFDKIEKNELFGEIGDRENSSTYLSVQEKSSHKHLALIDVTHSRQGRGRTIKLHDVYLCPCIEKLDEEQYTEKHAEIWENVIVDLISTTLISASGCVTKFYARNEPSLKFVQNLHKTIDTGKLKAMSITVGFEGRRWLTFNKS